MQFYTLTTFIGHFSGYLLGDRGYPCLPYMMTPYPEPEPGPQAQFNLAHSRTQVKVEMTIGILKSTFQCLRGLRVSPERSCDITAACVVLHNIATLRGESPPPPPPPPLLLMKMAKRNPQ
ncbi:hypothetical protein PO909_013511 [Leuciscus waleckii]